MAQVIWAEPALSDLNEIAEYIELDNFIAAQCLVTKVLNKIERLKEFPKSGRIPPELKDNRYREVIVGPCRIFYRVEKNKIYILYVMREERILRNFLIEERAKNIS